MFMWYDYLILFIVLIISTLIGLYYGCFGGKQSTLSEYLFGGKKMKIVPIAISMTIGHVSAISLVGVVADIYRYGAYFWFICFAIIIVTILAIFVYFPVLFNKDFTSAYEYLEKRFDRKCRIICSFSYILYENLLLPVIAFSPALALSFVTGIHINVLIILICGTCVFYTAIGGIRTVIWTDIFQFFVCFITLSVVLTLGINSVGGITQVWIKASKGQRLDIFDFDLDPTKKDSFWINTFGLAARNLYFYCLSQASIQKYVSLPNFKACVRSIIITCICVCITYTTLILFGLVIYANYADCDPFITRKLKKLDEIVPFFVTEISKNFPGINGLFMATLVCASISSLSSIFNSLSSVIYKDFAAQFLKEDYREKHAVTILKIIVVVEGIFCIALAFVVPYLGDILPIAISLNGFLDGPSIGLFTLGILFPGVNSIGAFCGTVGGMAFVFFIYSFSIYYKFKEGLTYPGKPVSVEGCSNITQFYNNSILYKTSPEPFSLFRISYNYYALIGAITTILLGLVISKFTETRKKSTQIVTVENNTLLVDNPEDEL